jgi:hypothetical protein
MVRNDNVTQNTGTLRIGKHLTITCTEKRGDYGVIERTLGFITRGRSSERDSKPRNWKAYFIGRIRSS